MFEDTAAPIAAEELAAVAEEQAPAEPAAEPAEAPAEGEDEQA